jgi:DNA-binding PadR family transcriptional regulator
MSVTRLLILGTVRLLQPANGYAVRRELLSWQADQWAHLNPGSVYNALRSLTRDALLVEHPAPDGAGAGPATRATYELTAEGLAELVQLTRAALWRPHPFEPAWLAAGWSFAHLLTRVEVLQALSTRRAALEADLPLLDHMADAVPAQPSKPDHVLEHFRLQQSMIRGELSWVTGAVERIEAGAYWFEGEPEHDEAGRRRDGMTDFELQRERL